MVHVSFTLLYVPGRIGIASVFDCSCLGFDGLSKLAFDRHIGLLQLHVEFQVFPRVILNPRDDWLR